MDIALKGKHMPLYTEMYIANLSNCWKLQSILIIAINRGDEQALGYGQSAAKTPYWSDVQRLVERRRTQVSSKWENSLSK